MNVIKDEAGQRVLTLELTDYEAGIIKAVLGECNSTGVDSFAMFDALPENLPKFVAHVSGSITVWEADNAVH